MSLRIAEQVFRFSHPPDAAANANPHMTAEIRMRDDGDPSHPASRKWTGEARVMAGLVGLHDDMRGATRALATLLRRLADEVEGAP